MAENLFANTGVPAVGPGIDLFAGRKPDEPGINLFAETPQAQTGGFLSTLDESRAEAGLGRLIDPLADRAKVFVESREAEGQRFKEEVIRPTLREAGIAITEQARELTKARPIETITQTATGLTAGLVGFADMVHARIMSAANQLFLKGEIDAETMKAAGDARLELFERFEPTDPGAKAALGTLGSVPAGVKIFFDQLADRFEGSPNVEAGLRTIGDIGELAAFGEVFGSIKSARIKPKVEAKIEIPKEAPKLDDLFAREGPVTTGRELVPSKTIRLPHEVILEKPEVIKPKEQAKIEGRMKVEAQKALPPGQGFELLQTPRGFELVPIQKPAARIQEVPKVRPGQKLLPPAQGFELGKAAEKPRLVKAGEIRRQRKDKAFIKEQREFAEEKGARVPVFGIAPKALPKAESGTLRGVIVQRGGIRSDQFEALFKDRTPTEQQLSRRRGSTLHDLEAELKQEGFLTESESLAEVIKDPKRLSMRKLSEDIKIAEPPVEQRFEKGKLLTIKPGDLGKGLGKRAKESPRVRTGIDKIKQNIIKTGKTKPIEIDQSGFIVDGSHTYTALLELGVKDIPVWTGIQEGAAGRLKTVYPGLPIEVKIPKAKAEPKLVKPKPKAEQELFDFFDEKGRGAKLVEPKAKAKEIFKMTQAEFLRSSVETEAKFKELVKAEKSPGIVNHPFRKLRARHQIAVEEAILEGKIKSHPDYPGLKPEAKEPKLVKAKVTETAQTPSNKYEKRGGQWYLVERKGKKFNSLITDEATIRNIENLPKRKDIFSKAFRSPAEIAKDVNTLLGEKGQIGAVDLTPDQILARRRLAKDIEQIKKAAANVGKSVSDYLTDLGYDPKVIPFITKRAEELKAPAKGFVKPKETGKVRDDIGLTFPGLKEPGRVSGKQVKGDIYTRNRAIQKEPIHRRAAKEVKEVITDTAKGIDKAIGPISTRLGNIDPSLKQHLRKFELRRGVKVSERTRTVEPMLKKIKAMTKNDQLDFDLARKNGDAKKLQQLIIKYKMGTEYNATRNLLNQMFKEAESVGFEVGYREHFHPRILKDPKGFLEYFRKQGDWPVIQKAISAKEVELGRYLEVDEKAALINSMLRGFGPDKIKLAKPAQLKQREIETIWPEINRFYMSADGSLLRYLSSVTDAIEARKAFGRTKKIRGGELGNHVNDTVGHYVLQLLDEGKIEPKHEKVLRDIYTARFNEVGTRGVIGLYKNLSYIDTMGSPISAITQIGDLAWALYKTGPIETGKAAVKSLRGKPRIIKEDIGVDRIAQEFADTSKASRAVSKIFKLTGLEKIDNIGKEALINAELAKAQKRARNPKKVDALRKELKPIFEGETEALINDLKQGTITENVKLHLFNTLADFQPITLSEMPELYLRGGNGRIFYMLKTFTIKQFDAFRREAFQKMKNPKTRVQGIKNLVKLAGAFVAANASADVVKNLVLNRPMDIDDLTVDNLLRLFGISKFVTWKAREEGVGSALVRQIAPPFKLADALSKDINRAGDEKGLESTSSIPVFGKLYYWWFGKGKGKSERRAKKLAKKVSGRLVRTRRKRTGRLRRPTR